MVILGVLRRWILPVFGFGLRNSSTYVSLRRHWTSRRLFPRRQDFQTTFPIYAFGVGSPFLMSLQEWPVFGSKKPIQAVLVAWRETLHHPLFGAHYRNFVAWTEQFSKCDHFFCHEFRARPQHCSPALLAGVTWCGVTWLASSICETLLLGHG